LETFFDIRSIKAITPPRIKADTCIFMVWLIPKRNTAGRLKAKLYFTSPNPKVLFERKNIIKYATKMIIETYIDLNIVSKLNSVARLIKIIEVIDRARTYLFGKIFDLKSIIANNSAKNEVLTIISISQVKISSVLKKRLPHLFHRCFLSGH
jgi:hypothetical protein